MESWEEDELDQKAIEFMATAEGKILPLECSECGGYFVGLWDEVNCPTCLKGNAVLEKLLAKTGPSSGNEEEEFYAYKLIEYTRGWLSTRIELNVNLPASTWLEEMHALMVRRGLLKPDGKGGWIYDYPNTLADYCRLLTIVAAVRLRPFDQMCIIVKFWRAEYQYVKLTVIENGVYKSIMHSGPWSKWMKLGGKDEESVNFAPFHPVTFQYSQPNNKGFRELIDMWRNVEEGGVDALIQIAVDEVTKTN